MPWMSHDDVQGGPVFVSQDAFDQIWSLNGWTITSPPDDTASFPGAINVVFCGVWQPSTQYPAGALIATPGGGLMVSFQPQLTDGTFAENGFTRLTPDLANLPGRAVWS